MQEDDYTMREINQCMLDAYFHFRSNLPRKDEDGQEYKKCFKTTEEIAGELATMASVPFEVIVAYMLDHEYQVATQPDGTVAWAIWEKVMPVL